MASEADCEVWAENQRGEVTARGRAVAWLPAKVKSGAAGSLLVAHSAAPAAQ